MGRPLRALILLWPCLVLATTIAAATAAAAPPPTTIEDQNDRLLRYLRAEQAERT